MRKVYIPLNSTIPFYKQFPDNSFVWGEYKFVLGGECEEADFVVVLDDVPEKISIKCKEGGLILFPMETKSIKRYPKEYIHQFDTAFCFQDYLLNEANAKLSIPPFPWMLIYDFYARDNSVYKKYDYFNMPVETDSRLDKFCLFTSDKKFSRGHCDRVHFAKEIKKQLPSLIDIYGSGFHDVDVKYEVMSKYKYCIVIENDSVPSYRTEKLSDAILAGCYPLYYGDPNIFDFFDKKELEQINIHNVKNSIEKLKKMLAMDVYNQRVCNIKEAQRKVLYKWNTFSIITDCLEQVSLGQNYKVCELDPLITPFSLYTLLKLFFYQKFPYAIIKHFSF